ncbi:diacylglycerol kinase family protein [Erysipelothrix inopinata]|uniref:Diacylglycerol kinase family protein n=1 Tax=Erysipelothrix inopinata TaxID=225084 RepID=A0A7G9RXW4_9FIRM|nr:diacylglycerol kinase family protein [Erysipelothrix inopinata]QNN60439.1 diacylglycerol kinase family protein [Erysipelothrix inopinata]
MKSQESLVNRTIKKFQCAIQGIIAGLRFDKSIKIQFVFAILSIVFFSFFRITTNEWLFVLSAIFLVLITEFLNSAIEDVCDLVEKKYDLHVKEVKDIAAGAVLLAALYAVVVAVIIVVGRFI